VITLTNLFLALTYLKILCLEATEPPQNLKRWGLKTQNAIPGSSQHVHELKDISGRPLPSHGTAALISSRLWQVLHRLRFVRNTPSYLWKRDITTVPSIEATTGATARLPVPS